MIGRRRTSSASSRGSNLRLGAVVGGLVGVGLTAWLLASYGIVRIFEVLAHAGWIGIVVVIAFHLPQMLFSALGWQVIAGPGGRSSGNPGPGARPGGDPAAPHLRVYLLLRWIREAVNNLLPLAQIGGEFVVARLLQKRGVRLAQAVGGTIADLMLEMGTQVLFTVLGLVLLVRLVGHSEVSDIATRALLIAALVVAGAFVALWLGLAGVIERAVLRLGRSFGWPATGEIGGLHDALTGCFRAPGRVTLAGVWHLVSWLLGGIEVCLILHFFGIDISIGPGLIIESLGQALKAVGFAVPGAIGVQEGGYVVVCRLLGIEPQTAIALSLVKRVREAVLGIPGLILWHRTEAKAAGEPAASV
ncbi:MAG TPA: lysylphosphatidylglycerol synthase domain-containing protein [Steroidobacteraceae bacterium]|nr:lysylphosphatidylglycerol synthase domain-containing protein [Steroidobacteraceae bacterium]